MSIVLLCVAGTRICLVHHSPTQTLDCPQSNARKEHAILLGENFHRAENFHRYDRRRYHPTQGSTIRARGARAPGARHGIKRRPDTPFKLKRRPPPSYTLSLMSAPLPAAPALPNYDRVEAAYAAYRNVRALLGSVDAITPQVLCVQLIDIIKLMVSCPAVSQNNPANSHHRTVALGAGRNRALQRRRGV